MTTPLAETPRADAAALATELRGLVGKLKRRLRDQSGAGDLTTSQIAVLLRLEKDGPMTVSALARAEGMRPQSMGAVVGPLEASGQLVGAPDPADGRQTLYALSDTCRARILEGRAARQDWLTRALEARLSAPEIAQLAAAIELLKRIAED